MYTGCPLHFIKLKLPQLRKMKDAVSEDVLEDVPFNKRGHLLCVASV